MSRASSSSDKDLKTSVPSFDSFPDAPPAFDSFPSSSTSERTDKRVRNSREHSESSDRERRHKHSHHDSSSRKKRRRLSPEDGIRQRDDRVDLPSKDRSRSSEDVRPLDVDLVRPEAPRDHSSEVKDVSQTFVIDVKGDQEVRRYGRPYRGTIPKYRRSGYGHIVGLAGEYRITKETAQTNQGLEVVAGHLRGKSHSLNDRAAFARLSGAPRKRLHAIPHIDTSTRSEAEEFVALPIGNKHSTGEGRPAGEDLDLQGSGDEHDHSSEEEYSEDEGEQRQTDQIREKNQQFSSRLQQYPHDVDTWLKLAEFQDQVTRAVSGSSLRTDASTRSSTEKALCETKVSILEKALAVPANAESPKLHLALLRSAKEIWDEAQTMTRWQSLLKMHPANIDVWIEYITFRQTRAATFSVEDIMELYSECLSRLAAAAIKATAGSSSRQMIEENALYLLLRACLLLRQAGYGERSIAILQAMLELNFRAPDDIKAGLQTQEGVQTALADFEAFWDSEAPRFGEEGARGWGSHVAGDEPSVPIADASERGCDESYTDDPFLRWGLAESAQDVRHPRPTRTTATLDDDPFSVVLFADMEPFLFFVSSQDARLQLIYSMLFFLGLPVTPPDTATGTRLSSDTFLHAHAFTSSAKQRSFWPTHNAEDFLLSLTPFETIDGEAMEPVKKSSFLNPFDGPFKRFPMAPDGLFPGTPRWFSLLDQRDYLEEQDQDFLQATIHQLKSVFRDSFLGPIQFALQTITSKTPKNAIKFAKQALKTDSKNLLLWDAYARMETSLGNIDAARKVYATALSLSQGFTEKEKTEIPLLWRAWAELEWENRRGPTALAILVASSSDRLQAERLDLLASQTSTPDRPTSAQILRTRQYYQRQLDLSNSDDAPQSLYRHRISITFSNALLAYLTDGLQAAQRVFTKQLKQLRSESVMSAEEEEAHGLLAKLHYRHQELNGSWRPGDLRGILEEAIDTFPNNSVFHSLYLYNETRTRIDNRVRKVLDEKVLRRPSVTAEDWLFAIYAELHINSRAYNPAKVRSLFKRAVDSVRSSVSLWTLYIDFEIRQDNPRRAKRLLQRALADCPWSKALHLKPFSNPLRFAYRSTELKKLHSLMMERGLRIHVDLITSGWRSEDSEGEDEDEVEGEGELAGNRGMLLP